MTLQEHQQAASEVLVGKSWLGKFNFERPGEYSERGWGSKHSLGHGFAYRLQITQRRPPCSLPFVVSPFVGARHGAHIAHAAAASPGPTGLCTADAGA